jgi:Phage tail sheath C-terminal domain
MALNSPGVEVTIIDQSQYLPAPTNSIPLIVLATAQNKADPTGTGVAVGTTAANAGKLYEITSQRDLVTLYGNPFFYTTTAGTPIQGYELNEYGLLAAYSALGVTNLVYTLRADINLASLVGSTGRPTGSPADGTWWLDATNSTWGIYAFNASTGQFSLQTPIVITDSTMVSGGYPLQSIGSIGQYAVIAIPTYDFPSAATSGMYFYKTQSNQWERIGSANWLKSNPTIQGSNADPVLTYNDTFTISVNGGSAHTITVQGNPNNVVSIVAESINSLGVSYLSAAVVDGKLAIYSAQTGQAFVKISPPYLTIAAGTGTVLTDLGIAPGTYYQPTVFYGNSSQQPLWQAGQTYPRPSGSVWIKIGSAGNGYNPVISQWNGTSAVWVPHTSNFATSDWTAIGALDATGGAAIPAGTVYAQYNFDTANTYPTTCPTAPIYYWERLATGATIVTGDNVNPEFTSGPYTATIQVSIPGSNSLSSPYTMSLNDNTTGTDFVTAWAAAGVPFTTATLTDTGAIQIQHTAGGTIIVNDVDTDGYSQGLMSAAGFTIGTTQGVKEGPFAVQGYNPPQYSSTGSGSGLVIRVTNSYQNYFVNTTSFVNAGSGYVVGEIVTIQGTHLGGTTPGNDLQIVVSSVSGGGVVTGIEFVSGAGAASYTTQFSNWVEFNMIANEGAPTVAPADMTNWFYSVVDQVDIMVNTTSGWQGYKNVNYDTSGFPTPTGVNATDPNGPLIAATAPTTQSDGTSLVYGDIWIDTSDLENYPMINRWELTGSPARAQWVTLDNTDQTSPTGVLFADARWATNGTTNPANDPIPSIKSLLSSNYLDVDAPDHTIYPVGMLLFNTRRSGYNVKQYRVDYFNSVRFPDMELPEQTDAWVTESGLMANGAPYMGRKAQRAMVVKALREVVDTNSAIRDEDNAFNLIATPNYPELQPNMIVLNNDRGDTGFIIGDTPMRLPPDATAITAWANNAANADATGEDGLISRDTYMGLFYPSGITSDLSGNLVAVPPSHMMIRTILRNDTVAYPWFAPAGTRRGIIDNATNIGYINSVTGEFVAFKPNNGLRDVLYTNEINPLVFFTGNGLLNYGNKTSYASQSALDRINVARLVAYIRRQLTIAARPFVFEPNDALTRQQISAVIQSLFVDLVAKRGVYDYLVVCDTSNNTPARIDRNELWVDCAIEPVKAVEFIYIPVRVLNTGAIGNNNG